MTYATAPFGKSAYKVDRDRLASVQASIRRNSEIGIADTQRVAECMEVRLARLELLVHVHAALL
jgi:hypothetical protein